jgi:hypothetical protein
MYIFMCTVYDFSQNSRALSSTYFKVFEKRDQFKPYKRTKF